MADTRDIPLSIIDDPEVPARGAMDDAMLEELYMDIRDNGLYYPLIVKPVGDRYEVVDGHRRLLCIRRLQWPRVECKIGTMGTLSAEAIKLKTNLLREGMTDAEIAVFIGEQVERGATMDDLRSMAPGKSEEWINQRTDLLRGDKAVFLALAEKKINFSQARELNRCKADDWRAQGLHFAIADNIPARKLREYFDRNCNVPQAPLIVQAQPEGAQPVQPTPVYRLECAWCGGWKDTQNLIQIWIHSWHWDLVKQVLAEAERQQGGSNGQA